MRWVALLLFACHSTERPVEVAPTTLPAPASYAIRLTREAKVGRRSHDVIDGNVLEKIKANGKLSKDTKLSRHLDAISTTLALNDRREALKTEYLVDDFTSRRDGTIDAQLRKGQKIEVTRAKESKDAVLLVDGAPAEKELREALSDILSLTIGGKTDDEVFGTATPQAVGSNWPIDAAAARDDLFDRDDTSGTIAGSTTLLGVHVVRGIDCLELRAQVDFEGFRTLPGFDASTTVDFGSISATFSGEFPVDVGLPRMSDEMVLEIVTRVRVMEQGLEIPIESSRKQRQHGTYEVL